MKTVEKTQGTLTRQEQIFELDRASIIAQMRAVQMQIEAMIVGFGSTGD